MNKPKTHVIAGIIVILLLTLLTVNMAYGQSAPVFRIGVLGDTQEHLANGARLAIRDINAAGGVRGADGTQFQLELIVQPIDGTNVTNTIASLRDASLIAVLGPESDADVKDNLAALDILPGNGRNLSSTAQGPQCSPLEWLGKLRNQYLF